MTAPHRPDPDDLASALLDGLLDDDAAEAARRDPAVVARVAALAAARDAVAAPPPPPDPAARDRAIAAALSAFDLQAGGGAGAGPDAANRAVPTTKFDHAIPLPRRASPRPTSSRAGSRAAPAGRWARWLGAAAALVLVVAGLSLLTRGSDSDDGDSAATSGGGESEGGGGGDGGDTGAAEEAGDESGAEAPATTPEPGEVADLGDVDSPAALADEVRSTLVREDDLAEVDQGGEAGSPTTGPAPGTEEPDSAASTRASDLLTCTTGDDTAADGAATIALRARAVLDGEPIEVWALDGGGTLRLLAVDAGCAVVVDRPLPE